MEAKLGGGEAELLGQDVAENAAEKREVQPAVALAVAKLERET